MLTFFHILRMNEKRREKSTFFTNRSLWRRPHSAQTITRFKSNKVFFQSLDYRSSSVQFHDSIAFLSICIIRGVFPRKKSVLGTRHKSWCHQYPNLVIKYDYFLCQIPSRFKTSSKQHKSSVKPIFISYIQTIQTCDPFQFNFRIYYLINWIPSFA